MNEKAKKKVQVLIYYCFYTFVYIRLHFLEMVGGGEEEGAH